MIRLRPCAWCAEFFTSTQTTDPFDSSLSENILLDVIVSVIKLHRLLCLELKSMKTSLILTVGLCAASAVSAVTYPDSFKNCPKDHYASGSLEKCEDQKLVYGKLNYPAKEKTTKVWWRKDKHQVSCSKTHNVRPGVYCKKGIQTETFADALDICENAGGRLCTLEEVHNDDTIGTGCNYNYKRIWTSTPCAISDNVFGFMTTSGDKKFIKRIGGEKCMDPAKRAGRVRCCMDSVPESGTYPEARSALWELRVPRVLFLRITAYVLLLTAHQILMSLQRKVALEVSSPWDPRESVKTSQNLDSSK